MLIYDDDVGAHRAHDVHGQVVDESAVTQDAPLELHRSKHSRHRHAGAHRLIEAAALEYDFLARHHVGRDRAIGDGKLVEALHVVDVARQLVQKELEVAARQRALVPEEFTVAVAHLERQWKLRQLFLAAKADIAARRTVESSVGQLTAPRAFAFRQAHAAGVEAATIAPIDVAAI